jgi:tetratricopeptide (TPR) repeat protein
MTEPPDPDRTIDRAVSVATPDPTPDPNGTVDLAGASVSTGGDPPGDPAAALPVIPGYHVVGEIARGGMGRVLAARELALDRDVAIKVLLPMAPAGRFVRESKITARLPHPGIPPVHALGTLADGSPFLAMKLIAGQTLSAEMKAADRPRLLRAFVQVCQAVGFAHSRGVVHRDLKPANVMVGAFGEVQVMDWGLAKELAEPDAADDPRVAEDGGFDDSTDPGTRAGAVMGTPGYMAPEQARGEPTDPRADVFSLGGILCALLTGHPPFRGDTSVELVRRAAAADLADAWDRLDGCGADADLVALCRRCLNAAPADRPATGQAVADELSAHLSGVEDRLRAAERGAAVAAAEVVVERRRRRQVFAAAAVAVAVLVAGIAGTTLGLFEARRQKAYAEQGWGKADAEFRRAETNFGSARDLVLNMGAQINLIESTQKDPRLADLARRQALDDARRHFERFREDQPDDERVQFQAANLHRYAANVSRMLREYPAAVDAYDRSLKIMDDLTARFPTNPTYRDTLALALADRALLDMLVGRLDRAAADLDRARGVAEAGAGSEPQYLRTAGLIDHDRAKVAYLRGRFDDSLRFATRAGELLDRLNHPGVELKLRQSIDPLLAAMAVNDLAVARRELGRPVEALAAHDDAAARMAALDGPKASRDVVFWVCEVREQRARTAAAVPDRRAAAEADLVEVVRVAEKLVEDYPHVPHYLEKLAVVHAARGELLTALGRPGEAAAEVAKSLAVSRALLDKFDTGSAALLVRGRAFLALGHAHAAAGKAADARAAWGNAAKVFEIALRNDPDNAHHRRGLAAAGEALKPPAK